MDQASSRRWLSGGPFQPVVVFLVPTAHLLLVVAVIVVHMVSVVVTLTEMVVVFVPAREVDLGQDVDKRDVR